MGNQLTPYAPLLMQILAVTGIAAGMIILSAILGYRKFSKAKMQAYECGITPTGNAQHRFSVKFYLVAMIFILFDIEAIFLIPWAVVYKDLLAETGMFGFWEMLVYLGIVLVGFAYVWKKGVFDWNTTASEESDI